MISRHPGDREGFLNSILLCNYRDILRYFLMMKTAYVADINKDKAGYVYNQSYRKVLSPHDAEYILSQKYSHW